MFKPRSRPPVAGGAFFSWGPGRAAAEPKSGAARAPADKRLKSRLETPRRPGSLFIPSPFPKEVMRAPDVGTNRVGRSRTNDCEATGRNVVSVVLSEERADGIERAAGGWRGGIGARLPARRPRATRPRGRWQRR